MLAQCKLQCPVAPGFKLLANMLKGKRWADIVDDQDVFVHIKRISTFQTISIEIASTTRVRSIKTCIMRIWGDPHHSQRLIYNMKTLQDDEIIYNHGVAGGSTIYLGTMQMHFQKSDESYNTTRVRVDNFTTLTDNVTICGPVWMELMALPTPCLANVEFFLAPDLWFPICEQYDATRLLGSR